MNAEQKRALWRRWKAGQSLVQMAPPMSTPLRNADIRQSKEY